MNKIVAFAVVAAVSSFATPALADGPPAVQTDTYQTQTTSDGYSVNFVDDLLQGGGIDSNAPLIKVRPRAARSTLIRPRTQFVGELLKTVENL